MFLRWESIDCLNENDALEFFNKNESSIMSIFSQYHCMYPELDDEEISLLTIIYMVYGEDENVPDTDFKLKEEEQQAIVENGFLLELYSYIFMASTLHEMTNKKLMKAHYDKDKGCNVYILTELGKKVSKEIGV